MSYREKSTGLSPLPLLLSSVCAIVLCSVQTAGLLIVGLLHLLVICHTRQPDRALWPRGRLLHTIVPASVCLVMFASSNHICTMLIFDQPHRPTQPGHPCGVGKMSTVVVAPTTRKETVLVVVSVILLRLATT